jgi:tRNA threonylcarbamoyladenosine biosynthesis protein TsaB
VLTLAFDTSASGFSVALLDDEKILQENIISESGKQSELLVPEIEKILKTQKIWYQDLDLIAATNGPGTFTGTRIALTVARTLKAALNIPTIFVNCLEAAAFVNKMHEGKIVVTLDAAMDEVFIAEFFCKNKKLETVSEPHLASAADVSQFFPKDNFLLCKNFPTAKIVGLLAYEKFSTNNFSQNSDALYLRAPRIMERKK